MKETILNIGGTVAGTVGASIDSEVVAVLSMIAAGICAVRAIVYAVRDIADAVRRRKEGETTTEEMANEITEALKGGKDHDESH